MVTGRPPLFLLCVLSSVAAGCARPAARSTVSQGTPPAPVSPAPLARVRPPPPRCTGVSHPRPQLLVSRAEVELERGDHRRALACADEALRAAPRLVAALHYRAAALVELGRLDEARIAYAHALAIDPDDPNTLHGAADLYIHRLEGDRSALLVGLEYALRGARAARRPERRDEELAASLLVLAAVAENDVGDSDRALSHADEALRLRGRDPDALYARGVALYELCRFAEARGALEAVLAQDGDDAWALHYLALVSERLGENGRSEALERRARQLAPDELSAPVAVDREAFALAVQRAVAALPDSERRALREVPVEIAEVPSLDDLTAVEPPLSPSILGLFRGPPERVPCLPEEGQRCRSIVFYRQNLIRFARSRPELEKQVRMTLLHELGHLHGESDDDLRARGLE